MDIFFHELIQEVDFNVVIFKQDLFIIVHFLFNIEDQVVFVKYFLKNLELRFNPLVALLLSKENSDLFGFDVIIKGVEQKDIYLIKCK